MKEIGKHGCCLDFRPIVRLAIYQKYLIESYVLLDLFVGCVHLLKGAEAELIYNPLSKNQKKSLWKLVGTIPVTMEEEHY